jgi:hypothetical protein
MSLLCNTNCGTIADAPQSYFDCVDAFLEFGSAKAILHRCDVAFTDALDAEEWATRVAGHDTHLMPPGKITVNEPSQTVFEVDGEGRKSVGGVTYTIDYETYQFGSDPTASCTYWQNVFANSNTLRLNWLDKNGYFYVPKEWATEIAAGSPATISGSTIGYEFSVTKIPAVVAGEAGKAKWVCQFEIRPIEVLHFVELPGVAATLS